MGFGPLVDAAWLAAHLREPDLLAVDIRWYLDGRSGRAAYDAGHIPGAVFLDLDEITGEGRGRHPLPSTERFQAAMRRIGVRDASRVLAYDDVSGSVAARLWWLLDLFGHRAAAVLDGGIRAWA
ncbi:MAG: rhodanese-like domain-containing protein, partial [Candidatus Dormibacteraceae bacterium]